jgi:hypothetical protein
MLRVAELYTYMIEREAIRRRRAAGIPSPWTDDPILRAYKFTNVYRKYDRTSRILNEEFYTPHRGAPRAAILFNAAVFRYFGTYEFARAVGWLRPCEEALAYVEHKARQRMDDGERVWTGAYMVRAETQVKNIPKERTVCDYVSGLLSAMDEIITDDGRWRTTIERIQQVHGFGPFMAKEVVLDARYAGYWPGIPSDVNVWCPMGPGAVKGAARLIGKGDFRNGKFYTDLSEPEALGVCLATYAKRCGYWPKEYEPLELHDIQWNLCEWDKYERVRLGQGRPRSRFKQTLD